MKFTLKGKNEAKSEVLWRGIVKFAESNTGQKVTARKVFSIDCEIDGERRILRVADSKLFDESVVVILETETGLLLVCTINRGVAHGMPILIGKEKVFSVSYFEE